MIRRYFRPSLALALFLGSAGAAFAQNDLLKELDQQTAPAATPTEYAIATFKSVRIVNGHSVETAGRGTMHFLIGHRFGQINDGAYNFFGLDAATIRLGLEYGVLPNLTVGIGRSSLEKTFDGFLKYRALRQGTGPGTAPITATLLATSAISTLKYTGQVLADRPLRTRLTYTYQALLARKFGDAFSLQLMPTLVHRNLVTLKRDGNDIYALGAAGRLRLTKRVALMGEYYYTFSEQNAKDFRNSLAVGFDIETGGHVFQLHLTNSQGMIEKFFIPQTSGDFFKGDIYFGFNISRAFTLTRGLPSTSRFNPR